MNHFWNMMLIQNRVWQGPCVINMPKECFKEKKKLYKEWVEESSKTLHSKIFYLKKLIRKYIVNILFTSPFLYFIFAAMISSKSIWAKEKSTKLWNMAKMAKTVHFITPMVYVHGILLLWLKLPQKLWLPEMWISLPLPLQLLVKWFKIQCLSFKYKLF